MILHNIMLSCYPVRKDKEIISKVVKLFKNS